MQRTVASRLPLCSFVQLMACTSFCVAVCAALFGFGFGALGLCSPVLPLLLNQIDSLIDHVCACSALHQQHTQHNTQHNNNARSWSHSHSRSGPCLAHNLPLAACMLFLFTLLGVLVSGEPAASAASTCVRIIFESGNAGATGDFACLRLSRTWFACCAQQAETPTTQPSLPFWAFP